MMDIILLANKLGLTVAELAVLTVDIYEHDVHEVPEIQAAYEKMCSHLGIDSERSAETLSTILIDMKGGDFHGYLFDPKEIAFLDRINIPWHALDRGQPAWAGRAK